MKPRRSELARQVSGIRSSLILSGLNVGRDVVLAPEEVGQAFPTVYQTPVIATDVETYFYAIPLTHEPMYRTTTCRICGFRVKVYRARWIFGGEDGESIPICDSCNEKRH